MNDQEKCELVAKEFRELLAKHQLAGFFVACAGTHATHGLVLDTAPWIRITLVSDDEGALEGVRVESKIADYIAQGMSRDIAETRQNQDMANTINALDAIALNSAPVGILTLDVLQELRARFNFVTVSKRVG